MEFGQIGFCNLLKWGAVLQKATQNDSSEGQRK
jgi:hypothetical protein